MGLEEPSKKLEAERSVENEKRPELDDTKAIQALIRANLDSITTILREKYEIEGVTFGSSVRDREANDVDFRVVVENAEIAEAAAKDFQNALKQNGISHVEYEVATAYGNCPRLAYTARIGRNEIPVEIFFENKQDKTGVFGGLETAKVRHRRVEGLDQISRAQDIRSLLVSLLSESEHGGGKREQRMNDLRALYSRYTARALERVKERGDLNEWLSAGNPELRALIDRNRGTLDEILDELSKTTNPDNDNTPPATVEARPRRLSDESPETAEAT